MNVYAKIITLAAMLATVAWFFWNPVGWVFQWEPIVVFLFSIAGFIATEVTGEKQKIETCTENAHPNDILLFREFLNVMPSAGFIEFLKQHDFLSDFKLNDIAPLRNYLHEWDNAEHEFQNPDMERLRKDLLTAAEDFSHKISKYTSPNRSGFQAVRVDQLKHIEKHENRFSKEAEIINAACEKFFTLHQELVRKGRNICNLGGQNI